ncbi:MAG TPA: DUF1801 domain-containing protein [Vicinamibacterales bacterium]|jgi:uncharacterized protein YdhG (YjbR/CyaY superfamily)
MKKGKAAKTVDEYLAAVPEPARSTLEKIRAAIRAAAPEATEVISYGIPTFKYDRALVAFGAFASHCSLFPMSYAVIDSVKDRLKSAQVSKGTIRFPLDKPLPASLVRTIVKARIAENNARGSKPAASAARTRTGLIGWTDVVAMAQKLPNVEASTWYGTPGLKVDGKGFARLRTEAEGGLVLLCSLEEKERLLESGEAAYYTTPHYDGFGSILVNLAKVDREALSDLIAGAWRIKASQAKPGAGIRKRPVR